jgi:peptidoglycan/LPS O-acetylase OafA/YrhL
MSASLSRYTTAPRAKRKATEFSAFNLGSAFESRSNSIGFLRFAFAAIVLLNHSLILGGFASDDPLMFWSHGQISFASIAVDGFFVLSGYLITRSYLSSTSPARYLWRRFIRIFPAFWVCLLFTALVCAPIVLIHERGTLAGANWLRGGESPVGYLVHNWLLTVNQWNIWHLLASVPLTSMQANFGVDPGANGFDRPLWSLRYEWDAYLLVLVAGVLGVLSRLRIGVVAWAIFLGLSLLATALQPDWFDRLPKGLGMHAMFSDYERLRLWFLFALGALTYLYGRRIPMRMAFGLFATAILVATLAFGGYEVVGRIAFAYVCVWLAVSLPFRNFEAHGDFSYGLYIYGWLVAQMLAVFYVYELGPIAYIALSAVLTFGCAFLSWHLVEAPAQRLRSLKVPRLQPVFGWLPFVTSRASPEP